MQTPTDNDSKEQLLSSPSPSPQQQEEVGGCYDYEPQVSEQFVGIDAPCNNCGQAKSEHVPYAEWKAAQPGSSSTPESTDAAERGDERQPEVREWCIKPSSTIEELYWELIYAVGNKYDGETRHQTALRYIREREQRGPLTSSLSTQPQASVSEPKAKNPLGKSVSEGT